MKPIKLLCSIIFILSLAFFWRATAQITPGVYYSEVKNEGKTILHELKVESDYLVYSVYENNPPKFIMTLGGHFNLASDSLRTQLEFNSDYPKDAMTEWNIPYTFEAGNLTLFSGDNLHFTSAEPVRQDLDGLWLFATRGPDEGQDRRGDDNPRKTLKFLTNGRFQWIAYNTDSMEFFGTGGGSYTAQDGAYTEHIAFFSRDNARVGATLQFDYDLIKGDWHHTGKNSKGEPMYEIWAKR